MVDHPDPYHAFDKRIAVLEERMNTQLAKNESAIDRLRADMERRDKEAANRETRLILAVAAMITIAVAILGVGFAFLAVLIGLPN